MTDVAATEPPIRASSVPVVHAVTSDEIVSRADFVDVAAAVMRALGSRGALHLSARRVNGARLEELGQVLAAAQTLTGAWLIVNDRVDIALAVGAFGAQLTSRSLMVDDARHVAPNLALGASVHSIAEGQAAVRRTADWLVAGNVFATATSGRSACGMEFVEALIATTSVPVIAIGGVRPKHCRALRVAGVHGIAVIRGIWDATNAVQAARDYLSCYDDHGLS